MTQKTKRLLLAAALGLLLLLNLQGRDATTALSNRVGSLLKTVFRDHSVWIDAHIRKIGHTLEFFPLGLVCYCCFGWKGLVSCAVFSVLDQCFKVLLPSRHFDVTDLPYDMLGYILGSCTGWIAEKIKRIRKT